MVIQDARMEQAYIGFYQVDSQGIMQAIRPDALIKPTELCVWQLEGYTLVGDLADSVSRRFSYKRKIMGIFPDSTSILAFKTKKNTDLVDIQPAYLYAEDNWRKKSH